MEKRGMGWNSENLGGKKARQKGSLLGGKKGLRWKEAQEQGGGQIKAKKKVGREILQPKKKEKRTRIGGPGIESRKKKKGGGRHTIPRTNRYKQGFGGRKWFEGKTIDKTPWGHKGSTDLTKKNQTEKLRPKTGHQNGAKKNTNQAPKGKGGIKESLKGRGITKCAVTGKEQLGGEGS